MLIVKSASIMSAASLISISAATASEPDDLISGGGLLELEEAPMTSSELGEARGGFSIGGLTFDISVNVLPPDFNPLPNGVFGDRGDPFGGKGVFGNGGSSGGANAPKNVNNAPQGQQNTPSAPPPQQQAAQTPSSPAPSQTASQQQTVQTPPATTSSPSVQADTPQPQTPSVLDVQPKTQPSPNAGGSPTPPAQTVDTTQLASDTGGSSAPKTDHTSQPADVLDTSQGGGASGLASSGATNGAQTGQQNTTASPTSSPTVVASNGAVGSTSSNNAQQGQNQTPTTPSTPKTATSTDSSPGVKTKQTASPSYQMAVALKELKEEPEVVQRRGPNGVTNIINNSLNNMQITQRVNMDVTVQNYDFVMSMRRVSNITSQTVTQSLLLPGLN
ncbi:MAG: hypothetical protein CMI63_09105 [Parvularcula sp.]|nr:hypothetical protein [Parvularcula sp.]